MKGLNRRNKVHKGNTKILCKKRQKNYFKISHMKNFCRILSNEQHKNLSIISKKHLDLSRCK